MRSARALVAACVAAVVVLAGVVLPAAAEPGEAVTGTLLGDGFYPRAVRLTHAGAQDGTVLATIDDGADGFVYRSTDGGRTFELLSTIDPGPDAVGLCCIELFELPTQLGAFPAGTLLWAGSVTTDVGPPRQMDLRIWRSDDHGVTWVPHGSCGSAAAGLWEPFFLVTDAGELACHFSDEGQQPAHSQRLVQAISTDGGVTFSAPKPVVQLPLAFTRPGMPTAAKLPDGSWLLTYEICAWVPNCVVYARRSDDGRHWGDPADPGEQVEVEGGDVLTHTPVVSWSPYGGDAGTLILSGQILLDADLAPAPGNGRTLLINRSGGFGPWQRITAPVEIDAPYDNFCPNYSSPVLPLDGDAILELASAWDGGVCRTYHALGTLPPPEPTPTTVTTAVAPAAGPGAAATPTFTG